MSLNPTNIEWTHIFGPGTGRSWNAIPGCTAGCHYCYARGMAKRFGEKWCDQYPTPEQVVAHGLDPEKTMCSNFFPHLHEERLGDPIRRKQRTGIFMDSGGDQYDPHVPQEWRDRVWATCAATPQHIYFCLTKRPQNIADLPPLNVWLGVSCETSASICDMIPSLCATEAGKQQGRTLFVSLEPLLGSVAQIAEWGGDVDWIIAGAQSGPGAAAVDAYWLNPVLKLEPVFFKDSLREVFDGEYFPQEWPPV